MKKLESSLKNMALALTGFSVVAGGLLGWVNDVTAEPIAQANAKTLSDAIAVVVPGLTTIRLKLLKRWKSMELRIKSTRRPRADNLLGPQ